ncbi:MAG: LPS-assembly protein LptD, partial [Bradyrhizobium sp.]
NFDRWSVALTYGNYAADPAIGYLDRREGILGSGSVKVAPNWVVTGAVRWDVVANKLNQYVVGAGYVDDCFTLAASYVTSSNYTVSGAAPQLNQTVMLTLGMRTVGNVSLPVPVN